METRFSRRLDWTQTENALCRAERSLRQAGVRILDLTESNPNAVGLTTLEGEAGQALSGALSRAVFATPSPDPRGLHSARAAIADGYAAAGNPIDPERLLLTASSSESYSFLWKLLCDPGDTVLVPEPSYPLFDYLAQLDSVTTRSYRLIHDGTRTGDWRVDRDSVDDALAGARTPVGAIVVVSPNNPTGTLLDADTATFLDQRAASAGIAIVADEVFSDYVVSPAPAQVRCLAARSTEALAFSLGGLSKSCGLPQLKLGWVAVGGPDPLVRKALDRLELIADTYLSVSSPVQAALPDLLRLGTGRRQAIANRIAQNRQNLAARCTAGSPLSVLRSDGGWSAIVRLPAVRTDEQWALELLERDGVLVHPGYFFDLRGTTMVVVSLLPSPGVFDEALRRLAYRVDEVIR